MKLDLLVVAAHPDDAELSVGGTLLLAAEAGLAVGVLDLTAGEAGTRGSREERAAEASAAAEALGLTWRGNLDLGDARLVADVGAREQLAAELARLRPATLLSHLPSETPGWPRDRHPDHVAAGDLARDAAFLAGLTNLTGTPAHRPTRHLAFPSHELGPADLVVDVTPVWERKLAAARCHASQLDAGDGGEHLPGGSDIVERLEVRSRLWGERIGARHGEPLVLVRSLGLDGGGLAAVFGRDLNPGT